MRKLGLAVAVASALGVTSSIVDAYTVGQFANGLLVPFASYESSSDGTVVGLISCRAGEVNWVFLDENSHHITDGTFPMTRNDMYGFLLSEEAGVGLEGRKGYLVFTLDEDPAGPVGPDGQLTSADTPCLAGNVFDVSLAASDVAFVPTAPLYTANYNHGNVVSDLRFLNNDSITSLDAGAPLGETIAVRYFMDGVVNSGDDTAVVMWTVCKPPGTNTAIMYDDDQDDKSINFNLPRDELNVIDPETILGRDPAHLDGFITWQVQAAFNPGPGRSSVYCDHDADGNIDSDEDTQSALSYSIISAPAFGAEQTLYNPHSTNLQ